MFIPICTVIVSSLENKTPNPTIDFNFNFNEISLLYYFEIAQVKTADNPT